MTKRWNYEELWGGGASDSDGASDIQLTDLSKPFDFMSSNVLIATHLICWFEAHVLIIIATFMKIEEWVGPLLYNICHTCLEWLMIV